MYRNYFKRLLDITIAIIALIVFSPVLLCAGILLFFFNHSRIFFIQERPGRNSKIFRLIKLKTMNDLVDANGKLLSDAERLTVIGSWIRKLSIDELPQLINVIKGDMSLIGPRPLLSDYLSLYSDEQKRRHEVRPGMTGWAQVNGRNTISWEEKFKLDVWYVDHISFLLDVKIVFKTIAYILQRKGINNSGHATMPAFLGSSKK